MEFANLKVQCISQLRLYTGKLVLDKGKEAMAMQVYIFKGDNIQTQ